MPHNRALPSIVQWHEPLYIPSSELRRGSSESGGSLSPNIPTHHLHHHQLSSCTVIECVAPLCFNRPAVLFCCHIYFTAEMNYVVKVLAFACFQIELLGSVFTSGSQHLFRDINECSLLNSKYSMNSIILR